MEIATFEDLLSAAAAQPEPQSLLLAFARAEPEPDAAPGAPPRVTLVPSMCVDKAAVDVQSFCQLAAEADSMGQPWDMLLVTTMSGDSRQPQDAARAELALRRMLAAIRAGQVAQLLAFDRAGAMLHRA